MSQRQQIMGAVLAAVALLVGVAIAPAGVSSAPATVRSVDDTVRINEVQVVGSHNSYKRFIEPAEETLLRTFIGDGVDQMKYQHPPLPEQFAFQKVRQIELDVFADTAGGRYANPLLRGAAGLGAWDPAMAEPGIKVLHVQDVDYRSTCLAFVDCLEQIEGWSDANPSHLPLAVLVELKDDPISFGDIDLTTPEPWTPARMDELDAEIRSVMDPQDLITPDDVRGGAATLEEAVTTTGWPTLGESRGKVMFMMDNGGGYRTDYLAGHPTLQGRVLFTNANPGDDDAAFIKRNDPFDASIPGLVQAGYVVRTRADADTQEARTNDTGPRDAALASGAQWVSTDYQAPGMALGFTTDYVVEIPGGTVARCNPVIQPVGCIDAELDTIVGEPPVTPPTGPTPTDPPMSPTTVPGGTAPAATPARPVAGTANYTG